MNLLDLVQKTCGRIGSVRPDSLSNLSADQQDVLDWIKDEYNDLQLSVDSWSFLENNASFTINLNKREYTITELGDTTIREIYEPAYLADSVDDKRIRWMERITPDEMVSILSSGEVSGCLTRFTFSKDTLSFDSIPQDQYKFHVKTYRAPYIMENETDTPVFAAEYHIILYYGALIRYSVADNDPELYQYASDKHMALYNRLLYRYCPAPVMT